MAKASKEITEFKTRMHKEVKLLRERAGRLTEENLAYKKAIDDMRLFFTKVNSD
jgi:hypothetical protein